MQLLKCFNLVCCTQFVSPGQPLALAASGVESTVFGVPHNTTRQYQRDLLG
ncbi:hypothetical protein PR003_g9053 [Phytophthora rubi]|uniref:Uncharacterized protein n=1 Tax=Phytophthora rubi TaxID=129364 RepID=A0A6A3K0F2_9STRA|nr:hypothetical protein PR002_g18022 [Phytophthora rubi]KAE9343297.1 hypothetical protein PR003_g9053 [Phytophthora rubi]